MAVYALCMMVASGKMNGEREKEREGGREREREKEKSESRERERERGDMRQEGKEV